MSRLLLIAIVTFLSTLYVFAITISFINENFIIIPFLIIIFILSMLNFCQIRKDHIEFKIRIKTWNTNESTTRK